MQRYAKGQSIGERFASDRTQGFDYLRISLSLIVIFWHSSGVVGFNHGNRYEPLWLFARIAVPLFFALSGFLVASSLDRSRNIKRFLLARFLRIFPALVVVVVASAIILGPIFTVLDMRSYFSDSRFGFYFLNLVGVFRTSLPGVFAELPSSGQVNRSLWTIPLEAQCYIALSLIYVAGGFRRIGVLIGLLVVATAGCAWAYSGYSYLSEPTVPGRLVMVYFIAGTIVYQLRFSLPSGPVIGLCLLILSYFMLINVGTTLLSPLVVAYAAATLGCTSPRRLPIIFYGDYSYGLYLYGMPIQQILVALFGVMPLWLHFPLSVAAAGSCAVVSWHLIESPALELKRRYGQRVADRGKAAHVLLEASVTRGPNDLATVSIKDTTRHGN